MKKNNKKQFSGFQTKAVHSGEEWNPTTSISIPIFQTSTFKLLKYEDEARYAKEVAPFQFYTRWGNPTNKKLEKIMAELESGEEALSFGSGMGAVTMAILANLNSGDHIITSYPIYPEVVLLLKDIISDYGIHSTHLSYNQLDELENYIKDNTRIIYIETPSNPMLEIADLSYIAKICKKYNIISIVDNTFATPYNQNPLKHGIDIVVHSGTKYLGGHSDVVAGIVIGSKKNIEKIWKLSKTFGPILHPFDAWLIIRGLKTLGLRVEKQNYNALKLAQFLKEHKAVKKVYYPGLRDHQNHKIAKKQMKGFGGMLSFDLYGGLKAGKKFTQNVRVAIFAVSLGGTETLITHPAASLNHLNLTEEELSALGITPGLVRVSVGIEDFEDLKRDFKQALQKL
ncbi:methionine gamma-lyase [candidate division KSB1 bacterium]|nr:MAG: methionine gamma-lyase [candidate division KSB1 bacterium]